MISFILMMIFAAYLLGSISSAILISYLFGKGDPRTQGSGNPGATNILRIAGPFAAVLVLVFDVLKGTLSVYSAYLLGINEIGLGLVAIAACLGHMYPIYFKFKGGKGVATALGCLLSMGYSLAAWLFGTWLLVVLISGYSSLAAIVTVSLAPIYTFYFKPEYTYPVLMLSMLILFQHRANIRRLLKGQESKVWKKGKVNE
ncbi:MULTISPECIES: glycerol-3-phosphate 1-O-acyltransferase PlsY [Alteromonadaceae]|jgi:glycerol-3-phosphate acyltransferase PlsY|uniref:Glycerol-3-phosphate acyltransferase n=1 Tax=Brumicola blandensis TaxID=3075611 RepID=A0AAW8R2K7_9ALTE|nr:MULTISPECIES: glycerol-3-phosphate 1-O-acyltransferase PlsY [unclassified Alteromonas]MDT0583130.1 glycerol-3-phosphate 1-O-acyltransferase PlsY [Alteromonas sp. W409]MDT0627435.1 glycerol-3-phosphate 1-O-acyltransferase PlsY [Alteromonas sp. W364]